MFYLFRKKGTTWGTTNFLDFAISELQNGALLRSLTKIFLVRALLFGIASLAKMRSLALLRSPDGTLKNADFAMQIGDFNRNLWQFWLVFRVILSIMANFVNISVENSSIEKYAVVRICTLAGG